MQTIDTGTCEHCEEAIELRNHTAGTDWFHVFYEDDGTEYGYSQRCELADAYAAPKINVVHDHRSGSLCDPCMDALDDEVEETTHVDYEIDMGDPKGFTVITGMASSNVRQAFRYLHKAMLSAEKTTHRQI
jgi:hypothetical protein